MKTSITHNKRLTFQYLEDNDPVSAKSAVQILSLNLAYTLLLLNFLIICLCNSLGSFSITLTPDLVFLLSKKYGPHLLISCCNWTRTHKHLVCKRTLNHLVKLAKWFSCVVSIYLYGAFECMFLPCHVRVSEWVHTL